MALVAARHIVEAEGPRGLTARRVAGDIGYSVGTLYNLFQDLDDLILHLNGRTLDTLHEALADVGLTGEPELDLRRLAESYIRFSRTHSGLWNLMFEHRMPPDRYLPGWHAEKTLRLIGLLEQALAPLFVPGQEAERRHAAQVLWSSLRGICGARAAEAQSAETVTATLMTHFLAGVRLRAAGFVRTAG